LTDPAEPGAAAAPDPSRATRRLAEALLIPAPLAGIAYLVALRLALAPARPELVWWLVVPPAAAVIAALRVRASRLVIAALLELVFCLPLHALVTFIHAWRLD
jgi:hypothetical protein